MKGSHLLRSSSTPSACELPGMPGWGEGELLLLCTRRLLGWLAYQDLSFSRAVSLSTLESVVMMCLRISSSASLSRCTTRSDMQPAFRVAKL